MTLPHDDLSIMEIKGDDESQSACHNEPNSVYPSVTSALT